MTFKVTVKDEKGNGIPYLLVTANNEVKGESFSRGTDGNGYADVAMEGSSKIGENVTLSILDPQFRYKGFVGWDALKVTKEDQILEITLVPFV